MKNKLSAGDISRLTKENLALFIDESLNGIIGKNRHRRFGVKGEALQIIADSIGVSKTNLSKARKPHNTVYPKETFRITCVNALSKMYRINFYDDGTHLFLDTEDDSALKRLAGNLALNLVDVSSKIGDNLPYENILSDENLWGERSKAKVVQRERFVVITGAGASNAATPKSKQMPSSKDGIVRIRDAYKGSVLQKLITEKIADLSESFEDTEHPSFELQMRALISFSPEIAIRELRKICGFKHAPSLVYEILAHLLKHRFVDAIINFNYDELLDNAIQEELPNPGDFQFIYTAGHCQQKLEDLYIDNRIKHPIYIKCHGTISHPNSMRFTEKNAFTIEQAIQRHIDDLFMGKVPEAHDHEQQELPLNLIIFGFSMNNGVFNQIIQKVNALKNENITFWIFDRDPDTIEERIHQMVSPKFGKRNKIKVEKIELGHHGGMKEELKQLWKKTCASFRKPYKPKSIARHELVSLIFAGISPLDFINPNSQSIENNLRSKLVKEYYFDRLLVEIGIILLQSDGVIHLRQITGSRAGKMYAQFKKYENKSIHSFLRLMGLKTHQGFMDDTYVTRNLADRRNTENLVNFVLAQLKEVLTNPRKAALNSIKNVDEFKELAKAVRKRRLGMVSPQYVNVHDNLFSKIKEEDVMNTSLAWIYNYRRLIEQHPEKWDLMLAITEKGSFLNDSLSEEVFKNKYFELILATADINNEMTNNEEVLNQLNLLSGKLQFRPWWFHNKHMVLFLKRNSNLYSGRYLEDWTLVEGFYYTHRMLSRRYNPVRIRDHQDLKRMLHIYGIYWDGAISYGKSRGEENPSMKITSSKKSRDKVLQQLFDLYEDCIMEKLEEE